jgi:hypothetical protein
MLKLEIDNLKFISEKALKDLDNDWLMRFQKLTEEKNEEINKQLKKSIDILDENELIEIQLEKLYILIEEKNFQINALEERELNYQNEIKKLKMHLNSVELSNCTFKYCETEEKATYCDLLGYLFFKILNSLLSHFIAFINFYRKISRTGKKSERF